MTTPQGTTKREAESQGPNWQTELVFRDWKHGLELARANWAGAPSGLKPNLLLHGGDLATATHWLQHRSKDLTPQQQSYIRKSLAHSYTSAAEAQRSHDAHRKSQIKWFISFGATISAFVLFIGLELVLYNVWRSMNPGSTLAGNRAPFSLPAQEAIPDRIATAPAEKPVAAPLPDPVMLEPAPPAIEAPPTVQPSPPVDDPPAQAQQATLPAEIAAKAWQAIELGDTTRGRLLALEALSSGTIDVSIQPAVSALYASLTTRRALSPSGSDPFANVAISRNGGLAVLTGFDRSRRIASLSALDAGRAPVVATALREEEVLVGMDDALVALTGGDDAVRIWRVGQPRPIAELRGHEAGVTAVVLSKDRTKAVTTSWDETVKVWDTRTGRNLLALKGHDGPALAAAFDRDATRLATVGEDRSVRLWRVSDGHPVAVLQGHVSAVTAVEFSPDGARLLTTSLDGTARLWSAQDGSAIATLRADAALVTATFSDSSSKVAALTAKGVIHVWESADGAAAGIVERRHGQVQAYAIGGKSDLLAVVDSEGGVTVLDAAGKEIVAFSLPDGDKIVAAAFAADGIHMIGISDRAEVVTWPVQPSIAALADYGRRELERCFTAAERRELGLSETIPSWCAALDGDNATR